MKSRYRWYSFLVAVLVFPGHAMSAVPDDRQFQVEREVTHYLVNADGSYREDREVAIKVLKESALGGFKESSIGFSTSVQEAEILSAYTLKPDGRRVQVPASNFQLDTRSGQHGNSPVYSDQSTLTVVFPDLEVGDTTVLSYRLQAKQPMFEDHISLIRSYNPSTYYGNVEVTLDAPEDMPLRHQAWQMKESPLRSVDGRKVLKWSWQNKQPVSAESLVDTVYNVERYPGYAFSTFADYAQIAQAYGGKANDKARLTPRITHLANEVAGSASDPGEVAKLLYEWVATNITYAGNCIGLGAVVPRDLDVVLDNRMGDCKDQATLLQALLKAKGIDSTQALINAGDVYELPALPVASMVNHVINYIPELDLYADPTASTVPFGRLPRSASGKPVLLVDGHHPDARTPRLPDGEDWQRTKSVFRIQPDGSVKGTHKIELGGRLAVAARDQFRHMSASDAGQLVKRYFRQSGLKADGELQYDDPRPMSDRYTMQASFEVEQMLPLSGGIQVQPWFISFAPVSGIVMRNLGQADGEAGESACGGILSEEEYVFEFPGTARIASVPADVSLEREGVSYASTYRREGNSVHVRRVLNDGTPGPVCSQEYNAGYSALMRAIAPDLRSQIVYLSDAEAH